MTIPIEERKAAIERVLMRLAELCGDERGIRFGEADILEASPERTTINELQERDLVKQVVMSSSAEPYVITTRGWFEAQRVSGNFDSDEFHRRQGRLCAAMKQAVNDRRDVALVNWRELAQAADVPPGWLWNVFEAQVLYLLDAKERYRLRFEDGIVWIPPTFGQESFELD